MNTPIACALCGTVFHGTRQQALEAGWSGSFLVGAQGKAWCPKEAPKAIVDDIQGIGRATR